MSCLLVFATELERDGVFPDGIPLGCDCLVGGVGVLSTVLRLGRAFGSKGYSNAIQIGIAGAYRSSGLMPAEAVEVQSDCLLEFMPWEPNTFFASGVLPVGESLKRVKGATVLHCSSSKEMGSARGNLAQVESMEGAAFFAVCKEYGVKSAQVRAISNYAIGQDRSEWTVSEALGRLRDFFSKFPQQ